MEERERSARAFVQRFKQRYPRLLSEDGNKQFYHGHMEVEDYDVLVELSRAGEKKALEIVRNHMRALHQEALRDGRIVLWVPDSVSELALEVLIYGPPKAKSGPKKTKSGLRDTTIALLVKWVHERFGFPLSVNAEHRSDPDVVTAFGVVGDEFGLSERTIDEIWLDRKEMVTRRAGGAQQ